MTNIGLWNQNLMSKRWAFNTTTVCPDLCERRSHLSLPVSVTRSRWYHLCLQASDHQIFSFVSLSSYCLKFTKPHFRRKQHNKTGQNKTSIWTWHLWRAQGLGRAQHADSAFKGPVFMATPSRWPSALCGQWSKENEFSMLGFGLEICTTQYRICLFLKNLLQNPVLGVISEESLLRNSK